MSFLTWWTQRAGALSIFVLLALCYYVISRDAAVPQQRATTDTSTPDSSTTETQTIDTSATGAGIWSFVFAYYSFFIHVLVTFFPLRACWTVWQLTTTLKKASRSSAVEDLIARRKIGSKPRGNSHSSDASSETLNNDGRLSSAWSDGATEIELDLYDDGEPQDKGSVIHAIVIPNYKEEVDVLRETLDVLASHPRAQSCYDVSTSL